MKTKIKRLAQFLFDNAETIVKVLRQSDNYRSVDIDIDMFKHDKKPNLRLQLSIYDEKTTHLYLYDDAICIERFKQLCRQINENSGIVALPKPVKVRKQLERAKL